MKETHKDDGGKPAVAIEGSLTIMYKRGGDYNPDGGGWEWIMVNPDFSCVTFDGDSNTASFCHNCHTAANSNGEGFDYLFTHPRPKTSSLNKVEDVITFLNEH